MGAEEISPQFGRAVESTSIIEMFGVLFVSRYKQNT